MLYWCEFVWDKKFMKKLAVITSHPIQYNAPLFRLLTERNKIAVKVFYTWGQTKDGVVYDPDFKKEFKWDIPLLDGYEKEFVENISEKPGAGNFNGIDNRDLIERINQYNPDALLVYGWSFKSHLRVLRYFKGRKKIIFRGDSTLLDEVKGFSIKKAARRFFLKWVYRHIDVALFTGEANRQYYLKHGVKSDQLVHAPHAIENERFFDSDGEYEKKAAQWRMQLTIPETSVVFLFAGKLESKKDPLTLIESFSTIEDENVRLLIVGNGVLEKEAKQKAFADRRILFLDFQNQQQMPVVYRIGDVFVLPSKGPGETWGLCVNEAMACSRPIIVSDKCGCAADLVKENGFVFPAASKMELQKAIQFFIHNHEKRKEMGMMSRRIIERFSFTEIAEQIETVV
jgi:glycosyltransferase involved in cell wall biosynthesis